MLSDLGGGSPEALAAVLDEALAAHADSHANYLDQGRTRPTAVDQVERLPRVVVVEDHGVLTLGTTAEQAIRAADVFEHAVEIVDEAMALGGCVKPNAQELFDAEFGAAATLACCDEPEGGPLFGQIALVTGAASGIGQATSRALLIAGAHVLMTDRDPRVLDAVSEWPHLHYPGRFSTCACDVASEVACRSAVEAACDAFGGIDVLVSNAGTAPSGVLHGASGDAALRSSLDINLLGHQRVARSAAQAMIAQSCGGALLFNASKIAFHQGPEFGPYAVPKAALIALMRQYAVDLGEHGIRANAVNADRIRTKLFAQPGPEAARATAPALSPSAYFRANLLQRETTPEQVAEAFVFLATAGATTGCIITVDGGNPAAFPR